MLKPSAQLLIIGNYPGADEVAAKEPFIGPAGKNLFLLLSILRNDWVKVENHPFFEGQSALGPGFWQSVFESKIAIFNWHKGREVTKVNKKNESVTKIDQGDPVLGKDFKGIATFRERILPTEKHEIPILVLGKAPREALFGKKAEFGDLTHDGKTFSWYHPDPRNGENGRFWGNPSEKKGKKDKFKQLVKFLRSI
ncbi:MAG: hypothetical protein IT288_09260 [Bdellovibrionales bacterium]|nr:hypothetical protein [Bdellovibrionales bacterium]